MTNRSPVYPRSCFWPRCKRIVSADRLGCRGHWFALPKDLRARILEHFVPGQTAVTASREYLDTLYEVLKWANARQSQIDTEAKRAAAFQALQVPLF